MLERITGKLQFKKQSIQIVLKNSELFEGVSLAKKDASPSERIAIIMGHIHNEKEQESVVGFIDSFEFGSRGNHNFTFDLFSIENNLTKTHELARALLSTDKPPRAFVTLGVTASIGVADVNGLSGEKIPHIFIAGDSPLDAGIMGYGAQREKHMAGVTTKLPLYGSPVAALGYLLPRAKRVFFPYEVNKYDAGAYEYALKSNDYFSFEKQLEYSGYDVVSMPIITGTNIPEACEPFLKLCDVMVVDTTKAPSVQVNIRKISELCAEYKTPLFASSASAVRHGACLGFGNTGFHHGRSAGNIALNIFCHKMSPGDIGLSIIRESDELRFNNLFLGTQGVRMSREMEAILNARSIDVNYDGI